MSLLESTPAPKTAQMFHTERFVCSFKHIYKTPLKLEGSFWLQLSPTVLQQPSGELNEYFRTSLKDTAAKYRLISHVPWTKVKE